ncbi:protein disulfide-isomerase A4 [Eurytemora carolleeae]|uniref:protein disulfide-isomerase A4 n=1 Tax=Eurytemora carolleeae TaxID=1294199 RepID=UPI000C75E17C|nr:protein disulfide-isomerase A4 [Eurytemora carolleeae]XP_023339616.1 protein disulfide-isomerase A4 [Eurytemora carolleeae]XP_023339617.1 protein disulfide-isomerase A4 [Eurytemora carolleeae]|eukprot:XP_023339615.1 protein disulfide-isomerase A4-like [Eurytemora affinis]
MAAMKTICLLIVLINTISGTTMQKDSGPRIIEENEVQILTDEDWDEHLLNYEVYLVLFYKKECSEYKQFIGEYEKAADFLISTYPYTPLAKVDCTPGTKSTKSLCKKRNQDKLPIIRIYREETYLSDYTGRIENKTLINFVNLIRGPSVQNIESEAELDEVFNNSTNNVFISLAGGKYKYLQSSFMKIGDKMHKYGIKFFNAVDPKNHKEYIQYYGRILMVKPNHLRTHLENKIQVFCGKGKTEKDLEIWIKKTYKGYVGERTSLNKRLFDKNYTVVIYSSLGLDSRSQIKNIQYIMNRAVSLVMELENNITEKSEENGIHIDFGKMESLESNTKNGKSDDVMENLIADKFDGITILADKRDKATKLTDQLDLAICEKEDYSRELKLCGYRANEVSSNAILVCALDLEGNYFPLRGTFSRLSLQNFIGDLLSSQVLP